MISASKLISKIKIYNPKVNENLIQKAYIFSKNEHGNQKRHSGEAYFSHPLSVAEILVDLKMDEESIVCALLHDIVEDTDVEIEEIEKNFGKNIANLVDGVTKLGKIESIAINERVAENFRKLIIAMSKDIRVLLIKLADRLHNMRTLHFVPSKEKRMKKAKESLEIYAALASRIGLNKIKDEIEDLAFKNIDEKNYNSINEKLNDLIEKNKDFIDEIIKELREKLDSQKIDFEIFGRRKTPYSIYNKIKFKNIGFHHIYDIMAFRIIVKNISDIYKVLGVINTNYNMIPGSFRDYVSTPKENGYRSLHLSILGPLNKKIEIQIRDEKMHQEAEIGLAAHWYYKDNFSKKKNKTFENNIKEASKYKWIRDLISLFENSQNVNEALENSDLLMNVDEVFCFTPNGDIFKLPLGATALDFAYFIHSEVGNNCVSAKINGVTSSLQQKLENGDQVEIITSKNAKPSSNWLQFVTSLKAKNAIKNFIRNEKNQEFKKLGFVILNKFFISKQKIFLEDSLEKILPKFNVKTVDDLYVKVAQGLVSRAEILKSVYPEFVENLKTQVDIKNKSVPIEGLASGAVIDFAGCCNPIPGDLISGVINVGKGVVIHHQNCPNFKNLAINSQKIVDVNWGDNNYDGKFLYDCRISVIVLNKFGSVANVSSVIAKKRINISNMKFMNKDSDFLTIILDIEVKNNEQIEDLMIELKKSKKIVEVRRIFG